MGKVFNEQITVPRKSSLFEDHNEPPGRFQWRGRDFDIQKIGGQWRKLGRWWKGEGERHYFRVITRRGVIVDLCHDVKSDNWYLHELQD